MPTRGHRLSAITFVPTPLLAASIDSAKFSVILFPQNLETHVTVRPSAVSFAKELAEQRD
jgi:hypothetical protein